MMTSRDIACVSRPVPPVSSPFVTFGLILTLILVLPSAALQAYVGAAARRLGSVGDLAEIDPPRLILGAVGLIAFALLVTLVGAKAREALEQAARAERPDAGSGPEPGRDTER